MHTYVCVARSAGSRLPPVLLQAPLWHREGLSRYKAVTVLLRFQPALGNAHFLLPGFSSCLKINNDSMYLRITLLGSTLGFSQIGTARFLTTEDIATALF